jgi:PAS domain S-box-containing protein
MADNNDRVNNQVLIAQKSAVEIALLLREQALARLAEKAALTPEKAEAVSNEASLLMLHELSVHQIELEMQNEELRETQAALSVAQSRYFDLFDMAPLGYITLSETGIIEQANLAAATLFNMGRGELYKKPLSRLISREYQDTFYLKRKQLIDGGESQSFEMRMVDKNGVEFWVQMQISIGHDYIHRTEELRAVLINISERKRFEAERLKLELEMRDKNIELNQARLEAEKANLAKSDCLFGMSHELRTPLNSILGFAQLLESGAPELTPVQAKNVEQIIKAGWYLRDLVDEILDVATVESGKMQLSKDSISLKDLLSECQQLVDPQAKKREIDLDFSGAQQSYFVEADHTRLKQVMVNLLSNAIKYSNIGGCVAVFYSIITTTISTNNYIRISIKDSGPGLSQEKMLRLFEPFNRLGQENKNIEGTGIGLVVCKRLINLMGGVIGVETTVGEGSVFWIEMPLMNNLLK